MLKITFEEFYFHERVQFLTLELRDLAAKIYKVNLDLNFNRDDSEYKKNFLMFSLGVGEERLLEVRDALVRYRIINENFRIRNDLSKKKGIRYINNSNARVTQESNANVTQESDALTEVRKLLQARKRQARYRMKKKEKLHSVTQESNANVTQESDANVTLFTKEKEPKRKESLSEIHIQKDILRISQKVKKEPNVTEKSEIEQKFEYFWDLYGKKGNKKPALKAFSRVITRGKIDYGQIISGVERYKKYCTTENRWIKDASTWLNAEGWQDGYVINASGTPTRTSKQQTASEIVAAYKAKQLQDGGGFNPRLVS